MKKGNNKGSIRRRSNGTWEGRYSDGRDDNGRQVLTLLQTDFCLKTG